MNFQVRAITLDLDDTLWPFAPVGARVEHVLHDWLVAHVPRTAEQFPVHEMRRLREVINAEHPHLAHEFLTALVEGRDCAVNAVKSANWTCVGLCAHESALAGGKIVKLPAFTQG